MRSVGITLLVWFVSPAAMAPAQSLQEHFRLLTQEYKASTDAWHEKYDDSKGDDELIARYRDWPGWTFAPLFAAFGERAGASSEGFESVCELLKMGNSVGEVDPSRRVGSTQSRRWLPRLCMDRLGHSGHQTYRSDGQRCVREFGLPSHQRLLSNIV